MFAYESSEELFKWCKIPPAELPNHPQAKVKLRIVPTPQAMYEEFAAALLEEVKTNNAAGRPTRWILPCGPRGQYPIFIERVNRERISLKNVHIFHMDDHLDWQGRHLPLDHPFCYQGWMTRNFYDPIDKQLNVPLEQRHFPRASALDEMAEKIQAVGGVDHHVRGHRVPWPYRLQRATALALVSYQQGAVSQLHHARSAPERRHAGGAGAIARREGARTSCHPTW